MKKFLMAAIMTGVSAGAMAADLPPRNKAPAAPITYVPPAFTWTGFYAGFNTGLSYANFGPNFGTSTGGVVGVGVGYNYQINQFVVGAEVDYDFNRDGVRGNGAFGPTKAWATQVSTLRARAGYAMDRTLFFVTGGYAASTIHEEALALPASESHWRNGLALGGGVEYAITNNVTAKIEDIYTWYGRKTYFAGTAAQNDNSQHINLIRVGLNYKF
jgi:outer membrane immunogenic protein